MEEGRDLGEDKSGTGEKDEGEAGEEGFPFSRDHRLPECEDERKKGERGYDGGKKVKGRKRQIVVDTLGLVLEVKVHRADIQDRKAAREVLSSLMEKFPSVEVVYGDQGYSGEVVEWARGNIL